MIIIGIIEEQYRQAREKMFQDAFNEATPERRKEMLAQREKEKLERITERRHRENIEAQNRIADAIRSTRYWFNDL